jgi:hypothetical protein
LKIARTIYRRGHSNLRLPITFETFEYVCENAAIKQPLVSSKCSHHTFSHHTPAALKWNAVRDSKNIEQLKARRFQSNRCCPLGEVDFWIFNFLQFAMDGKNNSKTKLENVFFFIFMSSNAEMS